VSYNSSVLCTDQLYTDSGKLFKHPLSSTLSNFSHNRRHG
jgi:hypothetical protein